MRQEIGRILAKLLKISHLIGRVGAFDIVTAYSIQSLVSWHQNPSPSKIASPDISRGKWSAPQDYTKPPKQCRITHAFTIMYNYWTAQCIADGHRTVYNCWTQDSVQLLDTASTVYSCWTQDSVELLDTAHAVYYNLHTCLIYSYDYVKLLQQKFENI